MALSATSFVDEIYDQFLVCRMCSEIYSNPKVLTCMHTFCEKCLESHYEMEEHERPYRFLLYTRALTCPLCHSRTELPTGGVHRLPDNFLVANLADVVNRRKPGAKNPICEICKPGTKNELDADSDGDKRAVSKCLDCVKMLCRTCVDLHRQTRVTQNHGLFDVLVEKDIECKLHPNEIIRFYCEPCEACICVLCTFHDHKDHDVSSLLEALERHRGPFETLTEQCQCRIERLREQVELIESCERGLKLAEEHIRDSAIESIAAIRKRERDLLGELRETLGEQTLEFIAEKDTFKENLKNLEGTFQLTNAMLKGKTIDLLMVKKEMEEKLIANLETGLKKTPETLKLNVQLGREDCYEDLRKVALDNMSQTERLIRRTEANEATKAHDSKRTYEVQNIGIEKVDNSVHSRSVQTPIDLMNSVIKTDISTKSNVSRAEENLNADLKQRTVSKKSGVIHDDDYDDDEDEKRSKEVNAKEPIWQRPMAVVTVTEMPRSIGVITLRRMSGLPKHMDRETQMEQITVVDESTSMPIITFIDKETSTQHVHVLHKNVSTDNQTMVDKSTSTVVDVTAAYRGVASTRRMVMVSRGTCTPRMLMSETLPISTSLSSRGTPAVACLGNITSEIVAKKTDLSSGQSGASSQGGLASEEIIAVTENGHLPAVAVSQTSIGNLEVSGGKDTAQEHLPTNTLQGPTRPKDCYNPSKSSPTLTVGQGHALTPENHVMQNIVIATEEHHTLTQDLVIISSINDRSKSNPTTTTDPAKNGAMEINKCKAPIQDIVCGDVSSNIPISVAAKQVTSQRNDVSNLGSRVVTEKPVAILDVHVKPQSINAIAETRTGSQNSVFPVTSQSLTETPSKNVHILNPTAMPRSQILIQGKKTITETRGPSQSTVTVSQRLNSESHLQPRGTMAISIPEHNSPEQRSGGVIQSHINAQQPVGKSGTRGPVVALGIETAGSTGLQAVHLPTPNQVFTAGKQVPTNNTVKGPESAVRPRVPVAVIENGGSYYSPEKIATENVPTNNIIAPSLSTYGNFSKPKEPVLNNGSIITDQYQATNERQGSKSGHYQTQGPVRNPSGCSHINNAVAKTSSNTTTTNQPASSSPSVSFISPQLK